MSDVFIPWAEHSAGKFRHPELKIRISEHEIREGIVPMNMAQVALT